MPDPSDEQLREAAKARGFRLVKSRRRKPGGDFGRYGLVELKSGRECMGFGQHGLTATAEEVLSYLRGGEVASWKRSLIGVVGGEEPKPRKKTDVEEDTQASARPERSRRAPAQRAVRDTEESSTRKKSESPAPASRKRPSTSLRTSEEGGRGHDEGDREGPRPEPTIREATRRDAAALSKLIGIPASILADRLAAAIRNDEAPLVADQEGLVGAIAWTAIPTLQHGPRGCITFFAVAEDHRRQGLGARLLAEAERRLRDAGIETIELALEIDFDTPTGFLRHAGFTRTTNGYAKPLV
ncbi:MAG: GNAT family N-acetyltransferase [Allosphingosinicella sp.]|uniref:GNAT family N-acetyltransferase n=1 Tax=Allosphingosinicella sp. TaxID=2823234 RepID=UPI0039237EB1